MTGFREQGSGIPLTLLHGISYGAPYIAIPQAGHASYLDNEIFFNQQLLRIGEEVRDECTN